MVKIRNYCLIVSLITILMHNTCTSRGHVLKREEEDHKLLRRLKRQFPFFGHNNFFGNAFNPQQQFFQRQQQQQQPQQQQFPQFSNELIFSNTQRTPNNQNFDTQTNDGGQLVFVNNNPTVATIPPFREATTQSPAFFRCLANCQTTSEYNPICGSNRQLYLNEQKFNCARNCGADVEIVRRGSCQGLFPMMRG